MTVSAKSDAATTHSSDPLWWSGSTPKASIQSCQNNVSTKIVPVRVARAASAQNLTFFVALKWPSFRWWIVPLSAPAGVS
jgi:hypothetical protein